MYHFSALEGQRVKLIPLEPEHSEDLYSCSRDPEIWSNYPFHVRTLDEMNRFVQQALDGRDKREQFPFVVLDKETNEIVGTTRYLRISEENNNLNVGSTWYSSKVWRTRVNTESKYLLLKYAFEKLQVGRIEIVTTTTNIRSQRAIERLGAVREGLLRKKYYGLDYIIYSIIDTEWEEVKRRLEGYLDCDPISRGGGDDSFAHERAVLLDEIENLKRKYNGREYEEAFNYEMLTPEEESDSSRWRFYRLRLNDLG